MATGSTGDARGSRAATAGGIAHAGMWSVPGDVGVLAHDQEGGEDLSRGDDFETLDGADGD